MKRLRKCNRCQACNELTCDPSPRRPRFCRECAATAEIVANDPWRPLDTRESRVRLAAALRRLQNDGAAFRVIRDFAAFLEPKLAALLFLEADVRALLETPKDLRHRKTTA